MGQDPHKEIWEARGRQVGIGLEREVAYFRGLEVSHEDPTKVAGIQTQKAISWKDCGEMGE